MSSGRRWEPSSSRFTRSCCRQRALSHCERRPLIRPSTLVGCVPLRPNTCIRDAVEVDLRALWRAHQSTIHTGVASLEKLAEVLQSRTLPYVISHADLHPANLLRDHAGHVYVIDWDEVMLAPKERDFIFVREPQAGAFFQGYGQREIDWMALTYYLWERVVQELIEDARDVCFRDDWAEETRADAARLFHEILAEEGGTIDAAYE